jgi:hypothetical protein
MKNTTTKFLPHKLSHAVLSLPLVWQIEAGLNNPESSHYDKQSKSIYISNVAGDATGKDGNGYISKIDLSKNDKAPVKELTVAEWAKGFHAPKGLQAFKGYLWVSDIDRVARIEISDPTKILFIDIPGSKFLNDIAISPAGDVYVSDMIADRIYVIGRNLKASLFAEGSELDGPNGLFYHQGWLMVAGWGKGLQSDFSTTVMGRLSRIHPTTKKVQSLSVPFGNLDGLEHLGGKWGGFIVSDWMAGKIYSWKFKDQAPLLIAEGLQGAADIGWIPEHQLLLVPEMKANRLNAFQIPSTPSGNRENKKRGLGKGSPSQR